MQTLKEITIINHQFITLTRNNSEASMQTTLHQCKYKFDCMLISTTASLLTPCILVSVTAFFTKTHGNVAHSQYGHNFINTTQHLDLRSYYMYTCTLLLSNLIHLDIYQ